MRAAPEIQAVGAGLMNQGPAGWPCPLRRVSKPWNMDRATVRRARFTCIQTSRSRKVSAGLIMYCATWIRLLERLSGEPELLTTLQTYFEQQQRRKDCRGRHGHPSQYAQQQARAGGSAVGRQSGRCGVDCPATCCNQAAAAKPSSLERAVMLQRDTDHFAGGGRAARGGRLFRPGRRL